MPVATVASKAEIKRIILAQAAKMTSPAINQKIDVLLMAWQRAQKSGASADEIEMEMRCWAELWLSRISHRRGL